MPAFVLCVLPEKQKIKKPTKKVETSHFWIQGGRASDSP